jgi:hypothetical protein
LHPTLAAFLTVLSQEGDLGDINRAHPAKNVFKYFNPNAEFPDDLSGLLPTNDLWWEDLGESILTSCRKS